MFGKKETRTERIIESATPESKERAVKAAHDHGVDVPTSLRLYAQVGAHRQVRDAWVAIHGDSKLTQEQTREAAGIFAYTYRQKEAIAKSRGLPFHARNAAKIAKVYEREAKS